MPEPTGHLKRGSSFWEPKEQAEQPRIFISERSAKAALVQWLRGEHHPVWEYEGDFSYTAGAEVRSVEHRRKEDMEVLTVYLTLNPCSALGLFPGA